MIPAPGLNVLAAAWLQFETRDWFSHGTDATCPFEVPRPPGDDWPTDPIMVPRTQRDPHADGDVPRTFVNTETHWWDASQIYGSTQQFQDAVRRPDAGPGQGRDRDRRPDRHRPGAARQLRRARRLVGRAGAAAHAVHARAQRRVRHARRDLPRLVGRRGVRQGPADHRRAHRQDPHRRVDHRDPEPARAADRDAGQLVRPRRRAGAHALRAADRQRGPQRHSRVAHRPPLRPVLDHRGVRRGLPHAPARSPTSCTCAPWTTRRPAHRCRSWTPPG